MGAQMPPSTLTGAPSPSPSSATPSSVESNPWVSYAGTQAEVLRRGVAQSTEAVLKSTRSYVKVLQSSSSQYSQSAQVFIMFSREPLPISSSPSQ